MSRFRCSGASEPMTGAVPGSASRQARRSHPRTSLAQIIARSRTAHSSVNRYLWVSLPDDEAKVFTVSTEETPQLRGRGSLGTEGRGRQR